RRRRARRLARGDGRRGRGVEPRQIGRAHGRKRAMGERRKPRFGSRGARAEPPKPAAPGPAGRRARSRAARARRVGVALLTVLMLLTVGVLGPVGWIGSEKAIPSYPHHYRWQVGDYPTLQPQPLSFTSRTRTTIAGRFFPGRSRATIVLSHGYGDDEDEMLPWADFLNRAGYSVLTYDMRNRGQSGGGAITLGALEQDDLLS